MKKVLVTGATGYIGGVLTRCLLSHGYLVHALVRDPIKAQILPPEIRIFAGDLFDNAALDLALEGVEEVFHVAAYAKPWASDPQTYFRMNVEGTKNVCLAAARNSVRRLVFTSTAGVFGPSLGGAAVNEETRPRAPLRTTYEQSKVMAEAMILERVAQGQDIVIVNPSRVYGPGPSAYDNGVTKMIRLYLAGKFRFYPGDGNSIGNYVFVEDVIKGHLLAMEKGVAGERYALGGENATYRTFFEQLKAVSGVHHRMFPIPIGWMRTAAKWMQWRAEKFGTPPLLTPEWIDRFMEHWELSSAKAANHLGYQPVSLQEGLLHTVKSLQNAPEG